MTNVELLLLTSAIWLAPSCRRGFQVFMGAVYLLIAAFVMFARH